MVAIQEYQTEILSLKKELPAIARKILVDNRDQVIRILKDGQLSEGIDSKGKIVGRYSLATQNEYANDPYNKPRQDKIAGQPYNFEWTGGLFDKTFIHFEDFKSFSFFSQDSKAKMLEEEYGDIFTLTKHNNERVNNEILRPLLYEEMIKRLFV